MSKYPGIPCKISYIKAVRMKVKNVEKFRFKEICPESNKNRIFNTVFFDVQDVLDSFFVLSFPQIYSLYSQDIYLKSFSVANSSKHVCIEYKLLQPEFDALHTSFIHNILQC